MNSNFPHTQSVRLDSTKVESMLVNFKVRIEKSDPGSGACHIEGIEFQPTTYEIQEFFLPFVSVVRNGMDSYLKQIFEGQMPRHTLKNRLCRRIMAWFKKILFERKLYE